MKYQYKQLCDNPTPEMIDDTETMMRVVQNRQFHDQLEDVETMMRIVKKNKPSQACVKAAEKAVDAMYEIENKPIFTVVMIAVMCFIVVCSVVGILA